MLLYLQNYIFKCNEEAEGITYIVKIKKIMQGTNIFYL